MEEVQAKMDEAAGLVENLEKYVSRGQYDQEQAIKVTMALADSDKILNGLIIHHGDDLSDSQRDLVLKLIRRRTAARHNMPTSL